MLVATRRGQGPGAVPTHFDRPSHVVERSESLACGCLDAAVQVHRVHACLMSVGGRKRNSAKVRTSEFATCCDALAAFAHDVAR